MRLALNALRESEHRYRTLAEAAHDMIFILNRDLNVEYVNSFASLMFNRPVAEIVGHPMKVLFPSAIAQRQAESVRRLFEGGDPVYRGESLVDRRARTLDRNLAGADARHERPGFLGYGRGPRHQRTRSIRKSAAGERGTIPLAGPDLAGCDLPARPGHAVLLRQPEGSRYPRLPLAGGTARNRPPGFGAPRRAAPGGNPSAESPAHRNSAQRRPVLPAQGWNHGADGDQRLAYSGFQRPDERDHQHPARHHRAPQAGTGADGRRSPVPRDFREGGDRDHPDRPGRAPDRRQPGHLRHSGNPARRAGGPIPRSNHAGRRCRRRQEPVSKTSCTTAGTTTARNCACSGKTISGSGAG